MILNDCVLIYDDIISLEKQALLNKYFDENYDKFIYHSKSISLGEDIKPNSCLFPGWSVNINDKFKIDDIFFEIIKEIEKNAINKTNLQFIKNYRYKLNCFEPLSEIPPLSELYQNIHRDLDIEHLVILYYVNDSDGDTLLFKNKLGYTIGANTVVENQIKENNFSNLELIQKVTPKKGSVVIFDGNLLHCAGWPTIGKRFNVNYNVVVKKKQKNLI